jgi:hypothetical protein
MPRGRQPTNTNQKVVVKEITCVMCGHTKKANEYYQNFNRNNKTGKMPYCKECLKTMCLDNKGSFNIEKFKEMLKFIDRPFIFDLYLISVEDKMDTIGCYMKNIAMQQYRYLGWSSSVLDNTKNNVINTTNKANLSNESDINKLQEKYGYGFTDEEYLNFERKYKKLSRGYKEKTELHTERLLTYITHKVKEEMSTAAGQVGEAEKWAKLAQADATAAKLNVSQLSKSDITGGIDLLPQLVEAVEQHASLIPLLPKVLEQPYDDADLIMWANVNYLRHLEDKPFIQYRDIWNFYDKMIEEHYRQKGFNDVQIKEEKVKRNNIFRDLGDVYIEPLYEHPDDFIEDSGDSDEFI